LEKVDAQGTVRQKSRMERCAVLLECALAVAVWAAPVVIEEKFEGPLAMDWFWGLGTWTAKDDILRGFESGARRHGPVKMRRCALTNAEEDVSLGLGGDAGGPTGEKAGALEFRKLKISQPWRISS
jgi:hypothetical protein